MRLAPVLLLTMLAALLRLGAPAAWGSGPDRASRLDCDGEVLGALKLGLDSGVDAPPADRAPPGPDAVPSRRWLAAGATPTVLPLQTQTRLPAEPAAVTRLDQRDLIRRHRSRAQAQRLHDPA